MENTPTAKEENTEKKTFDP